MSWDVSTVCVVGSGGREHALARVLAQSAEVVVAPGNAGMPGTVEGGYGVTVTAESPEAVAADLFVIGPEAPLADGLADRLRADGRRVVGPGSEGARLESSKAFMKRLLAEAGVPSARFGVFDDLGDARSFLDTLPGPWVIKTDGLAGGKGVCVAGTRAEAEADLEAKLSGAAFGEAGRRVVVEQGLFGPECSLQVLCDGRRVVPLDLAQDFKRLEDGGEGPNTGGMGAYSPLPWAAPQLVDRLMEEVVEPLVHSLGARGIEYRGVLYAGLMLTDEGPKVLEYNVRFGDPEAQVVLPRLVADPVEVLMAVAEGRLSGSVADRVRFAPTAAVCVVLAAAGYPDSPRRGDLIEGLGPDGQLAAPLPGVTVLHAGTKRSGEQFVTAGGRVLGVVGEGEDVPQARAAAYRGAKHLAWDGMQYRHDIATDERDVAGVAR